jgi:hypothetical protein
MGITSRAHVEWGKPDASLRYLRPYRASRRGVGELSATIERPPTATGDENRTPTASAPRPRAFSRPAPSAGSAANRKPNPRRTPINAVVVHRPADAGWFGGAWHGAAGVSIVEPGEGIMAVRDNCHRRSTTPPNATGDESRTPPSSAPRPRGFSRATE